MLKVKIISIGSLKEKYLQEMVAEYAKRLRRYCTLELIQLDEVKIQNENSSEETIKALQKESEKIEMKLHSKDFFITLCVEGKQLKSEEFANIFTSLPDSGFSSVAFVIGSSHGLDEKLKEKSNLKLSFSKMTFPHQLMRGILLEQIYRAFQISTGGKYHK